MPQIPQADLTGLVLAGGQSRRWNGVDKAWVRLADRPLVAHVAERLASQTGVVWINANRDLDRYAALGLPVFTDDWPDALGPLAGIASALRRIETPWLLVAPVDGPRLPLDLGARLGEAVLREGRMLATVYDGERLQPAFLLIHRARAVDLVQAVAQGTRRLGDWVAAQQPAQVDARTLGWMDALRGANTPAELGALAQGA
jgi:molybdopterin-guanine dinucleotide biosynthesis protein A